MGIDTGLNQTYNNAYPIAGIAQSSKQFRDNFFIIQKAIENLQSYSATTDSIFSVSSSQNNDGSMALEFGFTNNAFVLPIGDPKIDPVVGMVRFNEGFMQVYTDAGWSLVSGPALADIITALESNPNWFTLDADRHGDLPGGLLHALATADGDAGFMSGTDKAKLDNLALAYTSVSVRGPTGSGTASTSTGDTTLKISATTPMTATVTNAEVVFGVDTTQIPHGDRPGGLLHATAIPNGDAGFLSGTDKAKLDAMVSNLASSTANGYMSSADKMKLDNLAASFTSITVNGGPLTAAAGNTNLNISGTGGISVNGVPGSPNRLIISLGNVGGMSITDLSAMLSNFNSQNDRDGSPIIAPTVANNTTDITNTSNTNGTANITFNWSWAGDESDIDGFTVAIYDSTDNGEYVLGTYPSREQRINVPADRRSYLLLYCVPDHYYSFFVSAYREVDLDIDPTGIIRSNWVHSTYAKNNPFQPATTTTYGGNFTGTIGGLTIDQILAEIAAAAAAADWSNVTGSGKPENNADITSENISLNTMNVGTKSAADIVSSIASLTLGLQNVNDLIGNISQGDDTYATAAQQYAQAAQLAQALSQEAEASAAAARNAAQAATTQALTYVAQVAQDSTTAVQARQLADQAQDAAVAAAAQAAQHAQDAGNSATAAIGSASASQSSADQAGSQAEAAQASTLSAVAAAAITRPSDFSNDATYFMGITLASQGVTFQTGSDGVPTYRQQWTGPAWLAPIQPFVAVAGRRLRATVNARYYADGASSLKQAVGFWAMGRKSDGTYEAAIDQTVLLPVDGSSSGGNLTASQSWQTYIVEFVANSAFTNAYNAATIGFFWNNDSVANGTIEIKSLLLEDITESNTASVAAAAAVTSSQAAIASQNASGQYAQAAQQSSVSAATSAGSAQTWSLSAAQSATTAQGASDTAVLQAGVATNAARDAQSYTNAAAGYSATATSAATQAAQSSQSAISAAATAQSVNNQTGAAARAASGFLNTTRTYMDSTQEFADAAEVSSVNASTSADQSQSSASAAAGSAQEALSYSNDALSYSQAASSSATQAQASLVGAQTAAQAATTQSQASSAYADQAAQSASAAQEALTQAQLLVGSALPSSFPSDGSKWASGVTGSPDERESMRPTGTFPTVDGIGTVYQDTVAGSIAPINALLVSQSGSYSVSARFRVLSDDNSDTPTIKASFVGLSPDYETIVATIDATPVYTPLTVADGWVTVSADIDGTDLNGALYARPVVYYNQTSGTQTIQIETLSIQDTTSLAGAEAAARAAAQSESNAATSATAAQTSAIAAQDSSVTAQTAAGNALSYSQSAAQSVTTAQQYSNQAATSAGVAVNNAQLAGQSAEAASGSAQSAQTYSDQAQASSTAAAASEVGAATAKTVTQQIASLQLPSDFSNDSMFFTNNPTGQNPPDITYGEFETI